MVLLQKIIPVIILTIFLKGDLFGQFESTAAIPPAQKGFFEVSESAKDLSKIERIGYVCGASLAFSLFDYVGYNLVRENNKAPVWYRILQISIQTGISYFLYKQCGLSSAISFNLIWWTWGDDLGYYGWSKVIRHPSFDLDGVTWAWWTPIGLTRKKSSVIDNGTLLAQGMLGFWISIAIL